MFSIRKDERIAAVFGYCAIVIALLAITPWLDWARHGNAWVANLAGLPVVPAILLFVKRHRIA